MNKNDKLNVKVKIGLKSFLTVISILILVLIVVGVLTYIIPAGKYTIYTTDESKIGLPFYEYTTDESLNKQIVLDSYRELTIDENSTDATYPSAKAVYDAIIEFGGSNEDVNGSGLNIIIPIYGVVMSQPIVDVVGAIIATILYISYILFASPK